MSDKIRYTLRIDADLWARFTAIAEDNHRSINMELMALISRYVEAVENE